MAAVKKENLQLKKNTCDQKKICIYKRKLAIRKENLQLEKKTWNQKRKLAIRKENL